MESMGRLIGRYILFVVFIEKELFENCVERRLIHMVSVVLLLQVVFEGTLAVGSVVAFDALEHIETLVLLALEYVAPNVDQDVADIRTVGTLVFRLRVGTHVKLKPVSTRGSEPASRVSASQFVIIFGYGYGRSLLTRHLFWRRF